MYSSTRGGERNQTAACAIKLGLACDGGLFIPDDVPLMSEDKILALSELSYQERAFYILRSYLTDYTDEDIKACINAAYNTDKFDNEDIAPLRSIGPNRHVLELWHGPTSAFKDMALQLLPQLLSKALKITQENDEIVILVATSGDTGKAALEGFKDVDQTRIIVFYPQDGVSEIQRLQMVTQQGKNVSVAAVDGNFDDAQNGVKKIFNDQVFRDSLAINGYRLSSANSINWGRLVPQIIYYFSAYADMIKQGQVKAGNPVNFVVPTGNFGNILAGYYAKMMGLPIKRLICASNRNNVLSEFFKTGIYDRRRTFYKTLSPSMDILISSNLERLLYHITNGNTFRVAQWMNELAQNGYYDIGEQYLGVINSIFWADWVEDNHTVETIRNVYKNEKYLLDPHTAVAWQVADRYCSKTGDDTPLVILSTASPFKFNESVLEAIAGKGALHDKTEFMMLNQISELSGWKVPAALGALETAIVRHNANCAKENMPQFVKSILL